MATVRSDPLRNFKFQVQINYIAHDVFNTEYKLASLGFMSVSGLSVSTEVIPYREGGMNTTTRKMPGQSDYPPVTLQRGLFAGQSHLWQWFKDIFFFERYKGDFTADFRTTISIRVLPHPAVRTAGTNYSQGGGVDPVVQNVGKGKGVFKLFNAWPSSLAWSDLDAGGNGIIMEQMVVHHEGLVYLPAKTTAVGSFAAE
jgi:phage tail-like protein